MPELQVRSHRRVASDDAQGWPPEVPYRLFVYQESTEQHPVKENDGDTEENQGSLVAQKPEVERGPRDGQGGGSRQTQLVVARGQLK